MHVPPRTIDGMDVVMFSKIHHRHRPTDACRHIVGGMHQASFSGLAICQETESEGFYLFYCDEDWEPITDTFHLTLADAQHQAEFEYEGVCETWQQHG